jgi:type IV fimbrial biogenesis protein FimT
MSSTLRFVHARRLFLSVRSAQGFTLVELMVVVGIVVILAAVAVPSFIDTLGNNEVAAATGTFSTLVGDARQQAIRRSAVVQLCQSANSAAAEPVCGSDSPTDWAQGWISWVDANNDAVLDAGEVIIFRQSPLGVTSGQGPVIISNGAVIGFSNLGQRVGADAQFCVSRRAAGATDAGRFPRCVAVGVGGLVAVNPGVCPGAGAPAC